MLGVCVTERFLVSASGSSVLSSAQDGDSTANNTLPSYTTDQAAQQLTRYGGSWNGLYVTGTPATVTYAFRATAPATMPADMGGFSQLSAAQMAAAELALQSWADV